ncbi:DUF397 domain-containing protein [Actinokineospora auranticolor]|uniref:Uncharacterized protein DUF397 n=1 Tax=Actinokineospora auranticolor TaxID=155976 RepID=A0A2S6GHP8_9PSEU|nr:DUF397 domain-containing protein [Actinokineospora auranticolor]PPK64735.1 uncharacterized protein DUF397 [Actinokineospora auranticolor]
MRPESLRYKKSSRSGSHSNCVEVAHTLTHLRDSKNPAGPTLAANAHALIIYVRSAQR